MAVNINVKLNADDSSVKKKLSDLGKAAKKGLNFGGGKDGTPTSTGRPSKASTILEKAMNDLAKSYKKEKQLMDKQGKARYAWEKTKFVGGKVGRFAGAAAEGVHTGASLSGRATSGFSEFASGGFMHSVHDKISAAQDMYSKTKEGYTSIKDAYKGQAEQKDEYGNVTQAGRKGGIAAAAVTGIPVIGGVIGTVLGGVLNQINDMGKEYAATMRTQQGTIGATGGFVGGASKDKEGQLRGNQYFANSQMAQAQIAFNRTQGAFGNKSLMGKDKSAVAFAAQQNIGIAQYAEQLGQIKQQDAKISTDFLRGAADINNMTGLKQGQFIAKLAQYSTSLKEAGFNKQSMSKFAAMTGGLVQKTGMTGERAATVGQALDQGVRKGIHGGGAMSMMTISNFAKQNDMSIMDAQEYIEEKGLSDPKVQAAINPTLGGMSKDVRRFIGKQEFGMTTREAGALDKISPANIVASKTAVAATGSDQLALENARQSVITKSGGIGQQSFKLSNKIGMDSLEMFEKLNKEGGVLGQVVETLGKIEMETFKGIKSTIDTTNEYFKAFQDGELMKKMGKDFKEGFGSIFN